MKLKSYVILLVMLLCFPVHAQAITVTDRLMHVTLEDTVYSKETEATIHVRIGNPSENFDLRDVKLFLPDGQIVEIGYVGTNYTRSGEVTFNLSEEMINAGKFVVRCSYRRCWAKTGELNEQGTFQVEIEIEKANGAFGEWMIETGKAIGDFVGYLFGAILVFGIIAGLATGGDLDGILILFRRK